MRTYFTTATVSPRHVPSLRNEIFHYPMYGTPEVVQLLVWCVLAYAFLSRAKRDEVGGRLRQPGRVVQFKYHPTREQRCWRREAHLDGLNAVDNATGNTAVTYAIAGDRCGRFCCVRVVCREC